MCWCEEMYLARHIEYFLNRLLTEDGGDVRGSGTAYDSKYLDYVMTTKQGNSRSSLRARIQRK
jgi:hypothetical protein